MNLNKLPLKMFLIICLIPGIWCHTNQPIYPDIDRYAGLSFVAPPDPFSNNPMTEVQSINSNSIAVIPFGFTRQGNPEVRYNVSNWQWWGERPEGVVKTIQLAHQAGIKVMVKPQVYIPGSWTGALEFDAAEDWSLWEASYEKYILHFAEIADSLNVELFCIGTELKLSVSQRPEFWFDLIKKVKAIFNGQLTYAANWDDYSQIPFWNSLDFIGVDAYFPLSEKQTPSVHELTMKWQPYVDQLEKFTIEKEMPLLFTEYGYLSVDGCASKTWELESKIDNLNINEAAQANALDALFEVFSRKSYWKGGFLWKWFPNGQGHEGYIEKDYTPQNKKAFQTVQHWYSEL